MLAGTSLAFRQAYRRRPRTYQKRPRTVKKPKPLTVEDLAGKMRVTVAGGKPFELVHQGDGEFKGRQNRLIGSRVVECRYGFSPDKSSIGVEIEGTLLSPSKFHRHERPGHLKKGEYTLKDERGRKVSFEIQDDPLPTEIFAAEFLRGIADVLREIGPITP